MRRKLITIMIIIMLMLFLLLKKKKLYKYAQKIKYKIMHVYDDQKNKYNYFLREDYCDVHTQKGRNLSY